MSLSVKTQSGKFSYENDVTTDASKTSVVTLNPITLGVNYGPGTGLNQADTPFSESRSLTSTSWTYTLSALPDGTNIVKMKAIAIQVTAGGTLAVSTGGTHGWNGFTIGKAMGPNAQVFLSWPDATGAAVGAGATDQITFTATGTVTYTVAFIGTSV